MKLYDFKMAPNPRRVRIFLAEKGIEVETEQVDIPSGQNLGAAFRAVNPRCLLPTLVLDDGTVIDESVAICTYFEAEHPDPPLFGTDAKSKATIASAERHMELDGMSAVADAFRNGNPAFANRSISGSEGVPSVPGLVERGRAAAQRFFERLNATLDDSEFVAGSAYSVADITALCVVDFAKWIQIRAADEHPHIKRWYAAVSSRPSAAA